MDTMDTEAAASGAQPGMAGATLRAAREAAGLSVDAVAQQLKLAPRQVTALEEEDFQRLPGRTFVRGFARNYARCVHLDPETVLALLPVPESALDRPTFAAARRPMGEIPVEHISRPSSARWLLALLLAVVIAAAGYYEYTRQQTAANRDPEPVAARSGASAPVGPPVAAATSAPASSSADAGTLTTALPNPVSDSASAGSRAEPKDGAAAAGAAPGSIAAKDAASAAATLLTASDAALVLTFKGTSWAEVKDAHGRVILQMTGGAGMTQTVSGTAPLELALGNAPDVAVTFRGQALDLAPYTRGNVARVALK